MSSAKPKDIFYLDALRAIAILGVILIHVATPLVNMAYSKQQDLWLFGNFAFAAVRFAVPLFLMISGATLLGRDYSLKLFYKKRFSRVLIPFLFWLPVYAIFRWLMLRTVAQPHGLPEIARWVTDLFLKEGISKHFWYIYMILFLYLFIPLIRLMIRKLSQNTLMIVCILWMIITFALNSFPQNPYKWTGEYGYKFFGYSLYAGYLVLGFFLRNVSISSTVKWISGSTYFLTFLIAGFGVILMSGDSTRPNLTIGNYLHLNTMVQTIALFLLFKDTETKNILLKRITTTISNYSYGVYLVHIIIIGTLFHYGIYWNFAHPLLSLPALLILTLSISMVIIFLLRKIPGGKHISG